MFETVRTRASGGVFSHSGGGKVARTEHRTDPPSCSIRRMMKKTLFRGAAAIAAILLLGSPAPGFAQQRVDSPAVSSAGSGQGLPAARMDADTGRASTSAPRERTARFVTGTFAGIIVGATAGSIYGYHHLDPCEVDCLLGPGLEMILYAIMGGSSGGILGGLAGYFWPQRSAGAADLGVLPSRTGGVAVSLSIRQ